MTHLRDTFIYYLYDNLTLPSGITIHPVRISENETYGAMYKNNSINIEFLGINMRRNATQQVSIDVLCDDELICEDVVYRLWNLLKLSFAFPLKDYTNPASPVIISHAFCHIDSNRIYFKKLPRSEYCHYNCILELGFSI